VIQALGLLGFPHTSPYPFLTIHIVGLSRAASAQDKQPAYGEKRHKRSNRPPPRFLTGKSEIWKVHLRRLQHPLTGSKSWVEFEGTSHVRKVGSRRANLLELELNGPAGPIEGLSLRLYNPQCERWSVYFATSDDGALGTPMVGHFQNGRGEFSYRGFSTANDRLSLRVF